MDKKNTGAALIGTAKQCIETGNIGQGLELYWALKGSGFKFDRHTRYLEAITWSRIGRYEQARDGFQQLLSDEGTKGTAFRADVVRELAHVLIKLDQADGLEELLNEAEEIYKQQKMTSEVGTIRYLQGLVLMHGGQFEKGLKLIAEGTSSEMRVPDFVPPAWGGNGREIDSIAETARTALAVTTA